MRVAMNRSAFLEALATFGVPANVVADFGRWLPTTPIVAEHSGVGSNIIFSAGQASTEILASDPQYDNVFNAVQLMANRAGASSPPSLAPVLIWGGGAAALALVVGIWLYARR
jgi:hypothetical protein